MARDALQYLDHIVSSPDILGGKPTVAGTRISVERVLEYLAATPNFDELFADYPRLTITDVQACLAYAYTQVARDAKAGISRSSRQAPATA